MLCIYKKILKKQNKKLILDQLTINQNEDTSVALKWMFPSWENESLSTTTTWNQTNQARSEKNWTTTSYSPRALTWGRTAPWSFPLRFSCDCDKRLLPTGAPQAFTLCHVVHLRRRSARSCLRLKSKVLHCAVLLARLPANKRAPACGGSRPREPAHTSAWSSTWRHEMCCHITSGMPSMFPQSWWLSWGCSLSFHLVFFYSATLPPSPSLHLH